jgi:glycosyltransferase involved in cell wall biosynthesis
MRILMSVFSCGPRRGSEEGVGWNWAVETARLGHQVIALTQTELRAEIEAELASGELPPTLRFEFFMPPRLDRLQRKGVALGFGALTWHLVHLVWQILAYRHVRDHLADWQPDLVHHVTFGGIRHPTLMGRLPIPMVLGPIGGGERAPMPLRSGYRWRGWLLDAVRDLHTWLIRFDPITRWACADAVAIYVKTAQSAAALPARYRDKIDVRLEVGTRESAVPERSEHRPGQPLKLLFAGRFLYWKGMHLGLEALSRLLDRGIEARLTMLGRGPDEGTWRRLASALQVDHAIDWLGWIDHEEVGELYCRHHALLFPSLHDSSGNVVLEALNYGLPVVCLDLGGPAEMVDASCGRVVATAGKSASACADAIADALEELARTDGLLDRLSDGALARSESMRWPAVVAGLYADVKRRLQRAPAATAEAALEGIQPRHL